jgi:hypothetical protein
MRRGQDPLPAVLGQTLRGLERSGFRLDCGFGIAGPMPTETLLPGWRAILNPQSKPGEEHDKDMFLSGVVSVYLAR